MIKSSIEKLSETIGFEIGTSDDVTQANLINGLCKGLANSMDDHKLDLQLCFIADKLDSKSSRVLKSLVAFIELKEKQ
jgi:hypothetical protein